MFPGPLTSDCVEEVQPPVWGPACRLVKAQKTSPATSPQLYKHCQTISEILSQVHPAVYESQSEGHCSGRTERTWALVLVMCVGAAVKACKPTPLTHSSALLPLHGRSAHHHRSLCLLLHVLASFGEWVSFAVEVCLAYTTAIGQQLLCII